MDPASTKGVFEYHSVWVYIYISCKTTLSHAVFPDIYEGTSWLWSYSSWIYNYLCRRRILLLTLWNRIPFGWSVLDTTLCDTVCHWLAMFCGGQCSWWSPPEGSGENYRPVSSHVNFLPKLLFVNLFSCIYKPFNKIAFMFKRKTKAWFDLFCNVIFLWQNIASQWQTVSHNVVSSTLHPNGIRFHNVSNNMRRLHR
jgi:hypothetical protein